MWMHTFNDNIWLALLKDPSVSIVLFINGCIFIPYPAIGLGFLIGFSVYSTEADVIIVFYGYNSDLEHVDSSS